MSTMVLLQDMPGYQNILKSVLQLQIKFLVDQLERQTGDECIVLVASIPNRSLCQLGTTFGVEYLRTKDDLKKDFLRHCLQKFEENRLAGKQPNKLASANCDKTKDVDTTRKEVNATGECSNESNETHSLQRSKCSISRDEPKTSSQVESKSNTQVKSKSNTQVESKSNTQVESKSNCCDESKGNSGDESESNSQDDSKIISRDTSKKNSLDDSKSISRDEPKSNSQDNSKSNSQDDSKSNSRDELKSNSRDEPKSNSRDNQRKMIQRATDEMNQRATVESNSRDEPKSNSRDEPKSKSRDEPKSNSQAVSKIRCPVKSKLSNLINRRKRAQACFAGQFAPGEEKEFMKRLGKEHDHSYPAVKRVRRNVNIAPKGEGSNCKNVNIAPTGVTSNTDNTIDRGDNADKHVTVVQLDIGLNDDGKSVSDVTGNSMQGYQPEITSQMLESNKTTSIGSTPVLEPVKYIEKATSIMMQTLQSSVGVGTGIDTDSSKILSHRLESDERTGCTSGLVKDSDSSSGIMNQRLELNERTGVFSNSDLDTMKYIQNSRRIMDQQLGLDGFVAGLESMKVVDDSNRITRQNNQPKGDDCGVEDTKYEFQLHVRNPDPTKNAIYRHVYEPKKKNTQSVTVLEPLVTGNINFPNILSRPAGYSDNEGSTAMAEPVMLFQNQRYKFEALGVNEHVVNSNTGNTGIPVPHPAEEVKLETLDYDIKQEPTEDNIKESQDYGKDGVANKDMVGIKDVVTNSFCDINESIDSDGVDSMEGITKGSEDNISVSVDSLQENMDWSDGSQVILDNTVEDYSVIKIKNENDKDEVTEMTDSINMAETETSIDDVTMLQSEYGDTEDNVTHMDVKDEATGVSEGNNVAETETNIDDVTMLQSEYGNIKDNVTRMDNKGEATGVSEGNNVAETETSVDDVTMLQSTYGNIEDNVTTMDDMLPPGIEDTLKEEIKDEDIDESEGHSSETDQDVSLTHSSKEERSFISGKALDPDLRTSIILEIMQNGGDVKTGKVPRGVFTKVQKLFGIPATSSVTRIWERYVNDGSIVPKKGS